MHRKAKLVTYTHFRKKKSSKNSLIAFGYKFDTLLLVSNAICTYLCLDCPSTFCIPLVFTALLPVLRTMSTCFFILVHYWCSFAPSKSHCRRKTTKYSWLFYMLHVWEHFDKATQVWNLKCSSKCSLCT